MPEVLVSGRNKTSPNFKRLMKQLVREVRECQPSDERNPLYVERCIDADQDECYPRFFMGIESEDQVYPLDVPGLDKPLHVIGHVNEIHASAENRHNVFNKLSIEGIVVCSYPDLHALEDTEVGTLADRLISTS